MRFTRKMKALLFTLSSALLFITGCSLLESDSGGSVTFRIDGVTAEILRHAQNDKSRHAELVSASRSLTAEDVSTGSTTEGLYFDIALKGGYTASQTLPVTDGATATFDDIPVGTTLWAEGEAYRTEDGEKVILYTGTSEKITVRDSGETLGETALSEISAETTDNITLYAKLEASSATQAVWNARQMGLLDFSGWYISIGNFDSEMKRWQRD